MAAAAEAAGIGADGSAPDVELDSAALSLTAGLAASAA
jgi:hypothetical protein